MKMMIFLGTRPETIKLAPVIKAARNRGHEVEVVLTGQHKELVEPLIDFFSLKVDHNLNVMVPGQTLSGLSQRVLESLDKEFGDKHADYVLVQGDTTSAFIAAYWAFLRKIPVAHVEAGLRTYDLDHPFPEEGNRQLIGRIASFHFVPTKEAKSSLLKERVQAKKIFQVGNTAIDALKFTLDYLEKEKSSQLVDQNLLDWIGSKKLILITSHRRENFGKGLEGVCQGILKLLNSSEELCVILPVHPNPNIRPVFDMLLRPHPRVKLVEPLSYMNFVALMKKASLLLTDSGGVQEEGPTLRKPILVMRETTERPEGVKKGFAKLVGTSPNKIYKEGLKALKVGCKGRGGNPYGDGKTGVKIISILEKDHKKKSAK